jgi:hypothetical protein
VKQSVFGGPPPGARSSVQSLAQPSPATALASSQVSPQAGIATPSPQPRPTSIRQSVQPSQAIALASSHCSPLSVTPSPQWGGRQSVRQASGVVSLLAGPSSHRSHSGAATAALPDVPGVRLTMVPWALVRATRSVRCEPRRGGPALKNAGATISPRRRSGGRRCRIHAP